MIFYHYFQFQQKLNTRISSYLDKNLCKMASTLSREISFVTLLCRLLSLQNCRNADISPISTGK